LLNTEVGKTGKKTERKNKEYFATLKDKNKRTKVLLVHKLLFKFSSFDSFGNSSTTAKGNFIKTAK